MTQNRNTAQGRKKSSGSGRTQNKQAYSGRPQKGRSPKASTNRRKASSLDIKLLTQKAEPQVIHNYQSPNRYADLKLHPKLKAALAQKGFEHPTEIQDLSLEALLQGRDLMGIAQTGTGKTGAFLIPVIDKLLHGQRFKTLILAPTRELAVQIEDEFKSLTRGLNFKAQCYIGGTNLNRDLQKARTHTDLIVATPGRLLDLWQRKAIDFRSFEVLVLDEFDRMLDMGFAKEVRRITAALTKRKHTMLFSATLDPQQQPFINELLNNPVEVKVSSGNTTAQHVDQEVVRLLPEQDKFEVLLGMVNQADFTKVLIFAETKRWVSRVSQKLGKAGVKVDEIHGNKTQNYRQRALDKFKGGKIQVLVATDVAARGLDVSDISHVINYQLPGSLDSYIHRIGRTGRAGKSGKAYTFVN